MDKNKTILRNLMPHICIAEWGKADTETIMRDVVISAENKLAGISALPEFLPVLNNLANSGAQIFAFTADESKLAEISLRQNAAVQFFAPIGRIERLNQPDAKIIPAFKLKDVEHLDWNKIISVGKQIDAAGFMFIDNNGKNLHKFYDFLNIAGNLSAGEIHYCAGTNNIDKLFSAYRLVEKIRPMVLPKLRLFVTRDFFRNSKSEPADAKS